MSKNYARDYSRRKHQDSRFSLLPSWVWMLLGFIMGIACSGLYYLYKPSFMAYFFPNQPLSVSIPEQDPRKEDAKEEAERKIDFDFYTVLPKMEVQVAEAEPSTAVKPQATSTKPSSQTASKPSDTSIKEQYRLQIASFKLQDVAEELRTRLLLSGMKAYIEASRSGKDTWYRVFAGPYASLTEAEAAKEVLKQQNINGILKKFS